MSGPHEALRQARGQLHLTVDDVERQLSLPAGSLGRIEAGAAPLETSTLDDLARFYGLEPADVAQGRPLAPALARVRLLLEVSDDHLSATVRSEIARVAAARRDAIRLERELRKPERYSALRLAFPHQATDGKPGDEWRGSMALTRKLREELELGDGPLPSVHDLTTRLGIELVAADLSDARVAGFSLVDVTHGPAIVFNLRGANADPCVRRFTVAHEIWHVLHDEKTHRAPIQLYADVPGRRRSDDPAEVDGDRFGVDLLAPPWAVRRLYEHTRAQKLPLARQVQRVMAEFGVTFASACERLRHACNLAEEQLASLEPVRMPAAHLNDWYAAEATWDDAYFPCRSVPQERRGYLARLVAQAWRSKQLDRRQALELLHAAPDEPLESLSDLVEE